jgi:hypothetical protein
VVTKNPDEPAADPEAAQVALREGLERAKELVIEAKSVIGKDERPAPVPPNPAG